MWLSDRQKENRGYAVQSYGLDSWDISPKGYNFSYNLFESTLQWNSYYNWGLHKKVYENFNLNWILMASIPWFSLAINQLIY